MKNRFTCYLVGILFLLSSCQKNSYLVEPKICIPPEQSLIQRLPSCFEPLTQDEIKQDWGKEVKIADVFARELDLYRAITGYRRAEVLIPKNDQRLLQIQYDVILCYYLGEKYFDVIAFFESSALTDVDGSFPAFQNLLLILHDSYLKCGNPERAKAILGFIEKCSPKTAKDLSLSQALFTADFPTISSYCGEESYSYCGCFLNDYAYQAKSVRQAQTLNAILPGAGYYYVGQKKTALTSFLLNALFIAATYQFFDRGYVAAGIFTASLELGWYIGGINGAGLAAKQYNEALYEKKAQQLLVSQCLIPLFMFQCAF